MGNKVYEQVNNGVRVLKRTLIDGGYYDAVKNKYFYYLTDHLGNNRMVAEDNGNVIQHTHYYPFGMAFPEAKGKNEQAYKYNGKEQDTRLGLNLYDYSARYLDNATGRFTSIDPLAEKYYSWSPYVYTLNNPLRFIDIDGKAPGDVVIAFGGADIRNNKDQGSASLIRREVYSQEFAEKGGKVGSYSSKYWGTSLADGNSLDVATQEAYDFVKNNYNYDQGSFVGTGKVVIEGYSYGGVLATHLSSRLDKDGISVERLILVDAAAGPQSDKVNRTVSSNVKELYNLYQENKSIVLSRGAYTNGASQKNSNTNMSSTTTHSNIKDDTFTQVVGLILESLRNPVREKTDENR